MNHKNAQSSSTYLPWFVWGVGALFYLYEFFLQVSPNVMTNELMQAFHIDATHLGYLGSVYFISYAMMQIPVGLLLDKIGPRQSLMIATLVCAVGCLLFGSTHSFNQALLARFFLGFGSAFAAVSCLKIVASWFPLNRFAVLSGLTVTMGTLGAVIGQRPLALLVEHLTWRPTMVFLAILSLLITVLVAKIVRDKPPHHAETHSTSHNPLQGLMKVLRKRQCWIVAAYGGLMFAPTTVFGSLWGASFISTAYGIERSIAAGYISMLFVGWIFGGPIFGLFSDRMGRRKISMYIGSIGTLTSLIAFTYLHPPLWFLGVILFGIGFFSGGFLPSFSIILEINQPQENATALGFMNTLNMVGPILLQPLIGYVLDKHSSGEIVNGLHLYNITDYRSALVVLPICVLIAIFILPLIQETYCQRVSSSQP